MQVLSRGFYRIQISDVSSNDLICIFRRKRYKNGQSCKATWNCGYVRETITDFVPNNMTALSVKGKVASIVRGDHLTFEGSGGGYGWFQKISCRLISSKEKSCVECLPHSGFVCQGKNAINRGLGKKILTQTKSPIPPPLPPSKVKWSVRKIITNYKVTNVPALHHLEISGVKLKSLPVYHRYPNITI